MIENIYDLLALFICENEDNESNSYLLESWCSKVIEENSFNFSNGLIGTGWLLGFLIQNDYLDGDADIVLEDFDDLFYCYFMTNQNSNHSIDFLLDLVRYFYIRITADNYSSNKYRQWAIRDCCFIILKKILQYAEKDYEIENIDIRVDIIAKFSCFIKLELYIALLEKSFFSMMEDTLQFIKDIGKDKIKICSLLKLRFCIMQYGNRSWYNESKEIYDFDTIECCYDIRTKLWATALTCIENHISRYPLEEESFSDMESSQTLFDIISSSYYFKWNKK